MTNKNTFTIKFTVIKKNGQKVEQEIHCTIKSLISTIEILEKSIAVVKDSIEIINNQ